VTRVCLDFDDDAGEAAPARCPDESFSKEFPRDGERVAGVKTAGEFS